MARDGLQRHRWVGEYISDDLGLLAKEQMVPQGMNDKLNETGRRYGMEMSVEKNKVMRISKQQPPIQIMIEKQPENVKYFSASGSRTTKDARCTREIKSRIVMAKAAFNKMIFLSSKLDLHSRKKLVKCYIMEHSFVWY